MKLLFAENATDFLERHPRLLRAVYAVEAAVMYGFWYALRALGPERAARVGAAFLRTVGPRSRKKADLVDQQLRVVLPDADEVTREAIARRSWENLGMVFGDYPHLATIGAGWRMELDDAADMTRYRNSERGAIFFGAHYANWELMALAIARAGVPVVALYAPIRNPYLDRLMSRARAQFGCDTHPRGESVRPLLKHLRSGGSLGTLIDLRVEDGADLPFFGVTTRLPTTAARLARGTGADLVPILSRRLAPGHYRVSTMTPIELARVEDHESAEAADRETTRRMVAALEAHIRVDPTQWLLANRRWEKRDLDPTWEARRAAILAGR